MDVLAHVSDLHLDGGARAHALDRALPPALPFHVVHDGRLTTRVRVVPEA